MRKHEPEGSLLGFSFSLFVLNPVDGMPVRGIYQNGAVAAFDLKSLSSLADATRKGCFGFFRKSCYLVQIEVWRFRTDNHSLPHNEIVEGESSRVFIVAAHFPLFLLRGSVWVLNPDVESLVRTLTRLKLKPESGLGTGLVSAFSCYATCHSVFNYETNSLADSSSVSRKDAVDARDRYFGLPYDRKTYTMSGFGRVHFTLDHEDGRKKTPRLFEGK